ncbi:pre-rRNA-processing protein las1 isoform X2 [Senna tora]|uniref:Pre-rRNA-processing protein las1 isoform X2 n=1 Tax=Senna tora TaxID=362788 RepID=A0A834XFZ6_9FABA|nr:pre-rRNA-processing protein las1 isoform X2 [Senna tora]
MASKRKQQSKKRTRSNQTEPKKPHGQKKRVEREQDVAEVSQSDLTNTDGKKTHQLQDVAWNAGYRRIIVETDSKEALEAINKKDFELHQSAQLIRKIRSSDVVICHEAPKPIFPLLFEDQMGVKHGELLCGRNKLLTLMAGKVQTSKSGGSTKQTTKILKSLVQLYSSFSSEIVNMLLEYLMKALSSSELIEHGERASLGPTIHSILADWRVVILRFCNKEPELLLNLLKAVLHLIETQDAMKYDGKQCFGISHSRAVLYQIDHLSSLFAWLVGILSNLASTEGNMSKSVLLELLRKCLLISAPSKKQLMDSALLLAKLMDDNSMMERVKKLSLLGLSNLEKANEESSLSVTSKNIFKLEESIHQAAKKLELVKQHIMKNRTPMAIDCEPEKSQKWNLSKVWNPCPIGMLPRAVGASGYLPKLDHIDNTKKIHESQNTVAWKQSKDGAKRDATLDLHLLDNSSLKKMRETIEVTETDHDVLLLMEGEKGCLMVDGVWKRVREEEILAIESSVRILI